MPFWLELLVQYILPIISSIVGVGLFIWRVILAPSNKVEIAMHTFFVKRFSKKLDVDEINNRIKDLKLFIGNESCLSVQSFIETNRLVYFPVVPKPNLSVIHLVFLRHIDELQKLGLKVRVLIFDDYYRRKENIDSQNTKIHINNFVKVLKERGGKNLKLSFESKINRRKKTARIIYNRALDLCSRFSIAEINLIRTKTAPTTDENKPYIMQQKIIYNMAHLSTMKNVGFVLCGQDEITLWEKFAEKEAAWPSAKPTTSQLIILGIPLMRNSSGQAMSIWTGNNLYSNISIDTIKNEILQNINQVENVQASCGIFYLLDNLLFSYKGAKIKLPTPKGEEVFNNIDELIAHFSKPIKSQNVLSSQIDALASIVFDILHNKFNIKENNNG